MPDLHPCLKCVCKCEEQHQFGLTYGDGDGSVIIHLMDEEIIVWSGGILLLWMSMYMRMFFNSCSNSQTIHSLTSKYLLLPFYPISNWSLSTFWPHLSHFLSISLPPSTLYFLNHCHCLNNSDIIRQHFTEKTTDSYFCVAYLKNINELHLLKYWNSHIFQVDWLSGCSFA